MLREQGQVRQTSPSSRTLLARAPRIAAIVIGAKVVSHGHSVAFQIAEAAIPRNPVANILRLIGELRPPPVTSTG
jgi:hypothetical protein